MITKGVGLDADLLRIPVRTVLYVVVIHKLIVEKQESSHTDLLSQYPNLSMQEDFPPFPASC
jgi:hypothetical protein